MHKAYEVITNRIIKLLEEGVVPWRRPWTGQELLPRNLVSGKEYRGVNVFMLASAMYASPWWLTFKQAKERGGHVKKNEKGMPCIYWNWIERTDKTSDEVKKIPFAKYYTVFNVFQCENIPYPENADVRADYSPIDECEGIVANMQSPPSIRNGKNRACYYPSPDVIEIPEQNHFSTDEDYYSTLFHELIHSTGHENRLNRQGITEPIAFGSHTYGKEELVAEMGASFLCGQAGIENKVIENSASYISGWLSRLKSDQKLVVQAASQSQKAADYVLGKDSTIPYSEQTTI